MELKLQGNEHKGGWEDEDVQWLLARLQQEVSELALAVYNRENLYTFDKEVMQEAADVGNFAMMIASFYR